VPEGDTILWAATRMRPVLQGQTVEVTHTHERFGKDRWEERLNGQLVERVDTHGKNLLISFGNGYVIHSHLRMTGAWDVRQVGGRWRRSPRRAWLILRAGQREAVQFDGPVLRLMTGGRRRFDQLLAGLGPDILADEFDHAEFLARVRAQHQSRMLGDAVLDQRILAGIGNIWKAESCWAAQLDPWRAIGTITDEQLSALVEGIRPRMLESGTLGPQRAKVNVYRREGRPCPRCGTTVRSRGQGDENRTTYWCPGCQS
jgi:endonuclease-8